MKKCVQLELIEPMFSTYHNEGAGTAVMGSNPSMRNWYLNQGVVLYCTKKFLSGYTTPEVSINRTTFMFNHHLEKVQFPLRFIKGSVHVIIRSLLDEGYYVYFTGIDDYYIEGKSWYKKRHFQHDGLICGYDQNDKTYTMYAYDENWVYRVFRTSQKGFELGRRSMYRQGKYGMIYGIKPKTDPVKMYPGEICERIREHLDSSLEIYPPDSPYRAYGTVVHEYMAMYLDKLKDGSIPYERLDWRIFRVLWEHKKVMLERLQKMEEMLSLDNSISEQYQNLVKKANHIRLLYASYHLKRRDTLLTSIRNTLMEIHEKERELLTDFVNKAEAVIKK